MTLPGRFASLVKLEHTVFALPFAYVGALLAIDGVPGAADALHPPACALVPGGARVGGHPRLDGRVGLVDVDFERDAPVLRRRMHVRDDLEAAG